MNLFNKVINYFTRDYANNDKFHHSKLGFLRLFFERNNKIRNTNNTLGTVFRNSKWSDLKVANIKQSLVSTWSRKFLLFMVVIFLISCLGNTYITSLYETFWQSSHFIADCRDSFNSALAALSVSVYNLWSRVRGDKIANQLHIRNTLSTSMQKVNKPLPINRQNLASTNTMLPSSGFVDTAAALTTATNSLIDISTSNSSLQLKELSIPKTNSWFVELDFFSDNTISLQSLKTVQSSLSVKNTWGTGKIQKSLNGNDLVVLETILLPTTFNSLNAKDLLNVAKEDRWFLHNSLLNDNFILNTNSFTQTKRLLGSNVINSSLASKNIWASAKISNLSTLKELRNLSALQSNLTKYKLTSDATSTQNFLNPDLTNFEHFETSRMWLVKKFFMTQQLKNNTVYSSRSFAFNTNNNTNSSTRNTEFNTWPLSTGQDINLNWSVLNMKNFNQPDISTLFTNSANSTLILGNKNVDLLESTSHDFLLQLTASTLSSTSKLKYYSVLKLDTPGTECTNLRFFQK